MKSTADGFAQNNLNNKQSTKSFSQKQVDDAQSDHYEKGQGNYQNMSGEENQMSFEENQDMNNNEQLQQSA